MRPLEELIADDSGWAMVQEWVAEAKNSVQVLEVESAAARRALTALQVTTRSPMGAVVYHTGGLLVDDGWVRVLGSGCRQLPRSLDEWNVGRSWLDPSSPPPYLLVADDAVGGFFAVDGGPLGSPRGNVCYFAPDSLNWEDLERGYSDFLSWLFAADLDAFYEGSRWPGWQKVVAELHGDKVVSFYPPLWAEGPSTAERSRSAVPVSEMFSLQMDMRKQL